MNSSTSLSDGETSDGRQEETRTGNEVCLDKAEGTRKDHGRGFRMCETGTGQQVAQFHDG